MRNRRKTKKQKRGGIGQIICTVISPARPIPIRNIGSTIHYCHHAIEQGGGTVFEEIVEDNDLFWLTDRAGMLAFEKATAMKLDLLLCRGVKLDFAKRGHTVIAQMLLPRYLNLKVYCAEEMDYYGADSSTMAKMEKTMLEVAIQVRQRKHLTKVQQQIAHRSFRKRYA